MASASITSPSLVGLQQRGEATIPNLLGTGATIKGNIRATDLTNSLFCTGQFFSLLNMYDAFKLSLQLRMYTCTQ